MKKLQLSNGEIRFGYEFSELQGKAKEKAVQGFVDFENEINTAFSDTEEDAEQVGIEITETDGWNHVTKIKFEESAEATAKLIVENHGEGCKSYQAAKLFLAQTEAVNKSAVDTGRDGDEDYWYSDEIEEAEKEFTDALKQYYSEYYQEQSEYNVSEEAIAGLCEANEYLFDEDGEQLPLMHYVGNHPEAGKVVFNKKHEVTFID